MAQKVISVSVISAEAAESTRDKRSTEYLLTAYCLPQTDYFPHRLPALFT
ncbi:MAG: hypothetical protein JOZ31_09630 [Verrucomicrobia bacterium]|nr:hypothetical protein [Verrucomicrobiota bacterium]MBV8483076.1 hypothetical protein [Verrucomicrobiota bacterium]